MDYDIRLATEAEAPRLIHIELAAARRFPAGLAPDDFFSQGVPDDMFREAGRDGRLWVAVPAADAAAAPVGFALLRVEDGEALLEEVDVLPEHGRRGLGKRLIEAAANHARQAGHPFLYLTTFAEVPWNAPFYTRLGFTVVPDREMPPGIARILADERAYYTGERVAMRLRLGM